MGSRVWTFQFTPLESGIRVPSLLFRPGFLSPSVQFVFLFVSSMSSGLRRSNRHPSGPLSYADPDREAQHLFRDRASEIFQSWVSASARSRLDLLRRQLQSEGTDLLPCLSKHDLMVICAWLNLSISSSQTKPALIDIILGSVRVEPRDDNPSAGGHDEAKSEENADSSASPPSAPLSSLSELGSHASSSSSSSSSSSAVDVESVRFRELASALINNQLDSRLRQLSDSLNRLPPSASAKSSVSFSPPSSSSARGNDLIDALGGALSQRGGPDRSAFASTSSSRRSHSPHCRSSHRRSSSGADSSDSDSSSRPRAPASSFPMPSALLAASPRKHGEKRKRKKHSHHSHSADSDSSSSDSLSDGTLASPMIGHKIFQKIPKGLSVTQFFLDLKATVGFQHSRNLHEMDNLARICDYCIAEGLKPGKSMVFELAIRRFAALRTADATGNYHVVSH